MSDIKKTVSLIKRIIISVVVGALVILFGVIIYAWVTNTNEREIQEARKIALYDSLSSLPFVEMNLTTVDSAQKSRIVDSILDLYQVVKVYADPCHHPKPVGADSSSCGFISKWYGKSRRANYTVKHFLHEGDQMIIHGRSDRWKSQGPYKVIFLNSEKEGMYSSHTISPLDFSFRNPLNK